MEKFARTSHYISELLFTHDCVIVPSFGGFVCTYAPAKVHPAQHIFTPPSKQVFFNKHLQNNDGLLINSIAAAVPCSFEEAQKDVNAFVLSIQQEVKQGRRIELPHLGTLSVDPEGNISFESNADVNFLMDAFGLSSFQSMPVIRENVADRKKISEPVIRTLKQEEIIPVRKDSFGEIVAPRYRILKVAALIALPLVAVGLLFTLNTSLRGAALAGLGVSNGEPSEYKPTTYFSKAAIAAENNTVQPDANGIYSLSLDENSPGMIVNIHKADPVSTRVELEISLEHPTYQATESGKYYIIAGAFGVPENAENFRKSLVRKGYKPVFLENVRSKLTHISLAAFDSKEEAADFLSTIRGNIPEAWLLKK
ncbi:MAG TPA: SPOR domain-containing protein [Bacteroidia bacterium]|nr:SPOR domain-containing protein [Bacteroidia bacterium]